MRNQQNNTWVLSKIDKKITQYQELVNSLYAERENPSVAPNYHRAKGVLSTLIAVRAAFNGKHEHIDLELL